MEPDDPTNDELRREELERREEEPYYDDDGCWTCGGSGELPHDCMDDTCCCVDPHEGVCHACGGTGLKKEK